MILEVLVAAGVVADVATGFYDARTTVTGIKKGVGVEGNALITAIFGDKPSFLSLTIYNLGITAGFVGIEYVANHYLIYALMGGAIGALFADAGKHITGAKNWQWLMKGGNPRPKQSVIQKFIGLLSWNED